MAEMKGQVVFVGDQDPDDRGIILVGQSRVFVDVAQVLVLKLLHQVRNFRVQVVEAPEDSLLAFDLAPAQRDAVAAASSSRR